MITSLDQVTEFPLTWPDNKPRATTRKDRSYRGGFFGTNLNLLTPAKALAEIEQEMQRWKIRKWVLSMAPAYRVGAVDPGVALWWLDSRSQDLRVLACDAYARPHDNLHAIALTLAAMRGLERWGAYTIEQATEGARAALPPPEGQQSRKWWEVLGCASNWPLEAIELKYQALAKRAHPDNGGTDEAMAELNAAIEQARQSVAA